MIRLSVVSCGLVLGLMAAGCSSSATVPVSGQVVWEDGSPAGELTGYTVEAELPAGKTVTRGNIGPDGRFTLSTTRPEDGAEPGEYQVVIVPIPRTEIDPPLPVTIPTKYHTFKTSGLSFTVVRGEKNEPVLKLNRK